MSNYIAEHVFNLFIQTGNPEVIKYNFFVIFNLLIETKFKFGFSVTCFVFGSFYLQESKRTMQASGC